MQNSRSKIQFNLFKNSIPNFVNYKMLSALFYHLLSLPPPPFCYGINFFQQQKIPLLLNFIFANIFKRNQKMCRVYIKNVLIFRYAYSLSFIFCYYGRCTVGGQVQRLHTVTHNHAMLLYLILCKLIFHC